MTSNNFRCFFLTDLIFTIYSKIYFFLFSRDNDVVNDPAVKQTVVEQTKHWSEMIDRHQKENWELMKAHLQAQEEVLKKLMQSQQQLQIKELEAFFEK